MGNYCHSGETKQEEDNASQKSFTKTSTNVLPEPCNSENHDQSNTQDKFQINTTCSKQFTTENSLEKSEFQMLSKHSIESLSTYPTSLNILYGHQQVISKIKKQPKIVLYIISPLSGHSKEKDVLLDVYHQICNKYQSSEFEIFFCDLHYEINKFINNLHVPHSWGLEGHIQAVNCLSAISKYMNNCYLIPILLLSDFVGDLLLPLTFEIQDFLNLTKSISEKDIKHKELIEKWYKLDLNSKPECYRLELKSKIPVDEERKILDILIEVLSVELLDLYLTTILEQEVNQTILFNQDVAKRCLWIQNTSDSPKILDKELLRRISNLKQEVSRHLTDDQIFETTLHTAIDKKNMEISVKTSLCNIIEYIMDDYNCRFKIPNCTNGVDRKLLLELDNNDRYIKHLVQNRSNFRILQNIKSFINSNSSNLMVVEGGTGAGKTTLIAEITENINSWNPNMLVVSRFCKLSYYKCTPILFLRSIVEQLSILIKNKPHQENDSDMNSTISSFKDLLMSSKQPICILIDDFHLIYNGDDLLWFTSTFIPYIKYIITIPQTAEENSEILSKIHLTYYDKGFEMLKIECSEDQWSDIILHGVGDICSSGLTVNLLETLGSNTDRTLVKAKIIWWLSWLGVKELTQKTLQTLSFKVLEILENIFGRKMVSFIMSIIHASRSGLSESDIIQLLQYYFGEICGVSNTSSFWGFFSWLISPFLFNEQYINFMDSTIYMAIQEKYGTYVKDAHRILHKFYTEQPNKFSNEKGYRWNVRKFHELPYQSYFIDCDHYHKSLYLTDLSWISSKLICLGVCSFIEDAMICNKNKDALHVEILCQIVSKNFTSLNYDGEQFYSHVRQFIESNQDFESLSVLPEVKQKWIAFIRIERLWLKPKNMLTMNDKVETYSYDIALSLNCKGNYIALLSKAGQEICVWDIERCKKARIIKNVPQPQSICLVGNYTVAVLCNREIKIIDLDNGKHIITLKGVMNQKMPYFAIHDKDHIVCLSRNRMYVNLMNLKSGDCITTFKAGEDRFLNSLLVSGDGRILVCGDETSKPFPLLVWNLTQRKLLYDLRIPYHEFITSLSAITYEGSYVAVVAKEILEPSPNFIVVYDLQSGTLFKKWKPTCNSVSLTISQKNMCVIAGLEDAQILIWDLVTGNCRGTLIGHTAAVSLLKIDSSGEILLSGDQQCRDHSIRIWEINTGKHLSSFTPLNHILACAISSDGSYIVLSYQGSSFVQTLEIFGTSLLEHKSTSSFGNKDYDGQVFDLQHDYE